MNVIGIDVGTSLSKIIECDDKLNIIHKMAVPEKNVDIALEEFIETFNIDIRNIEKIILTGVGTPSLMYPPLKEIPIIKIDEFLATAAGGLSLANKEEAVIVSIGTGTSFVRAQGSNIKHIGGTGIGGGVLVNLCNRLTGIDSFDEIIELASKGDLSNVDLTIDDITTEGIPNLPKNITASNFGKLSKEATDSDIILGVINMIFETIGIMAMFATQNDIIEEECCRGGRPCPPVIKDVILVGTLAAIPYAVAAFERFKYLCDLNFIIPQNAEYATAIGAVKVDLDSRINGNK